MIDTLLERAEGQPLNVLLALSGAATRAIRQLDRELAALAPGSPKGPGLVAKIHEYERGEKELRRLVRAHHDFSYEGL